MKLGLGEILDQASQLKTKKEKIEYLQQNQSRSLFDIIQYAYHPEITWDLPEGAPPFRTNPFLDQENMLYSEMRRLYLFVNGNGSRLRPAKLENIFVQILESLSPKDAELLIMVKERKLPKGITPSLIEEAFPGLLPNEQTKEVPQK